MSAQLDQSPQEIGHEMRHSNRKIASALVVVALLVSVSQSLTVHKVSDRHLQRDAYGLGFRKGIEHWITEGYWQYAGLLRMPGSAGHPDPYIYRSLSGLWLQPNHLLQRAHKALTGDFSVRLNFLLNRTVVALAGILVGALASALVLKSVEPGPLPSVAGGSCCAAFMCSWDNLLASHYIGPQFYLVSLIVLFLLLDGYAGRRHRRIQFGRQSCVFLMVLIHPVFASVFLLVAVAVWWSQGCRKASPRVLFHTLALPGLFGVALLAFQLALASYLNPGTDFLGSGVLARTGLDGDTTYYDDHLDVLSSKHAYISSYDAAGDLLPGGDGRKEVVASGWSTRLLFAAGAGGLLSLALWGRALPSTPAVAASVGVLVGTGVLVYSIFSQATVIHLYTFRTFIVTPGLLALFAVPLTIVHRAGLQRAVAVAIVFGAVCYAFVELRIYSVCVPH